MDIQGPLDAAAAAMAAAPEDEALRLAFHARLAVCELFLLLEAEPAGDTLSPRVYSLEDGPVVLAFDSEARLAAFAAAAAPYAALPGRRLAEMLAGNGVGLGINLDVSPAPVLLPAESVDWLAATLAEAPEALEAVPEALHPPSLPAPLLAALDARLARAAGLARAAWLVGVTHRDGTRGHLLAILGATPDAEPALARAVGEAVALSGLAVGPVDVTFLAEDDPRAVRFARTGLRFDLPAPPRPATPAPPGSDPARPPRLR